MPKVQPEELARQGGDWLAECREWIQHNVPNGDGVTWGNTTAIPSGISVAQLEDLSAHVAARVMNSQPQGGKLWQTLDTVIKESQRQGELGDTLRARIQGILLGHKS
jgi:hypothetical protein